VTGSASPSNCKHPRDARPAGYSVLERHCADEAVAEAARPDVMLLSARLERCRCQLALGCKEDFPYGDPPRPVAGVRRSVPREAKLVRNALCRPVLFGVRVVLRGASGPNMGLEKPRFLGPPRLPQAASRPSAEFAGRIAALGVEDRASRAASIGCRLADVPEPLLRKWTEQRSQAAERLRDPPFEAGLRIGDELDASQGRAPRASAGSCVRTLPSPPRRRRGRSRRGSRTHARGEHQSTCARRALSLGLSRPWRRAVEAAPSRGRLRNASTCPSKPGQIRETALFETRSPERLDHLADLAGRDDGDVRLSARPRRALLAPLARLKERPDGQRILPGVRRECILSTAQEEGGGSIGPSRGTSESTEGPIGSFPTRNTYDRATAATLYLDLLKRALTRSIFDENVIPLEPSQESRKRLLYAPLAKALSLKGLVLARKIRSRDAFLESPPTQIRNAETLIGPIGLENIRYCVEDVLKNEVPGDLIEAGVWRGGAALFMRGVLAAHDDPKRIVWAADSFAGCPSPEESRYQEDERAGDWAEESWLAIPLDVVKQNFARYGLLDERVRFLVGWFHDTLPNAPFDQLSIIRLDGDMYGSTMDGLRFLYPKLSVGGYIIVDDYWLSDCRAAVDTFRAANGITDEIVPVDRAIVYWQRSE